MVNLNILQICIQKAKALFTLFHFFPLAIQIHDL